MGGWVGDKIKRQKPRGRVNEATKWVRHTKAANLGNFPLQMYKASGQFTRLYILKGHEPEGGAARDPLGLASGCGPDLSRGVPRRRLRLTVPVTWQRFRSSASPPAPSCSSGHDRQ